jgi:hypothetical protein
MAVLQNLRPNNFKRLLRDTAQLCLQHNRASNAV